MLMQNFKSAADLNLTERQKDALCKVLVLLETEKLTHITDFHVVSDPIEKTFTGLFNMDQWGDGQHNCGTIACIGGTAELLAGAQIFDNGDVSPGRLKDLFYPKLDMNWGSLTTAQAATALRSYLTTGDARWDLAVA